MISNKLAEIKGYKYKKNIAKKWMSSGFYIYRTNLTIKTFLKFKWKII